jgi:acyl carrier protein
VLTEHLALNTRLAELGLDSLDLVELIMELEEEGITIPDEVAANFRTIADAIRFIVEELRRRKEHP